MSYTGKKSAIATEYIENYIKTHALKPGSRLPTESELSKQIGTSRVTLRRALANLQERGLIYSIQGSGYFVSNPTLDLKDATIPLVISYNHEDSKILNIVRGAQDYLGQKKCQLDVHISKRDPQVEKELLQNLYDSGHRCCIIFPVSSEDNVSFYFSLIQKGMHLVFLDRQPQNISCCSLVKSDNMTGGYLATKHLIEQGHQQIAVYGLEPLTHTSASYERYLGYMQAMAESNLPVPEKSYYFSPYRKLSSDARSLLSKESGITAVFAINDHAAVDIATHAYNLGLKIPNDFAVVGFDNLDITTIFTPQLSTVEQPFTQIGRAAAQIAFRYFSEQNFGFTQQILPIKLIVRESSVSR